MECDQIIHYATAITSMLSFMKLYYYY